MKKGDIRKKEKSALRNKLEINTKKMVTLENRKNE